MIIFLMVIYVIVCVLLVTLILLQPSEGGGLSQTLGGGEVQTILGTKTTAFLVKITAGLAVLFLIICLVLAAISGKREKSLLEDIEEQVPITATREAAPSAEPESVEVETEEAEVPAPTPAPETTP